MIGLTIKVVKSSNKSLEGIEGKIIDETKNTFTIETKSSEKKLLKNQITFKTTIKGKTVIIEGGCLTKRPEDRIKKGAKI